MAGNQYTFDGGGSPSIVSSIAASTSASTDKETFIDTLSSILNFDKGQVSQYGNNYADMLGELWTAYDSKYKTQNIDISLIPQLVVGKKDANGKELTPTFNKEFAGYLKLVSNPEMAQLTNIKSISDYQAARNTYKQVLDKFQLKELATNENIDKFLENDVSPYEASDRLSAAYNAVKNADPVLKQQLSKLGITDNDLGKALLTGKDGALQLENKVREANLRSAEVNAGLSSVLDWQSLMNSSLNRESLQAGLSKTQASLGAYQGAASRQGENPANIQQELEKENLLGMASQRRARVAAGENNLFGGSAGTNSNVNTKKQSLGKF